MTILHMNSLRQSDAMKLHQNIAGLAPTESSLLLITEDEFGIAFGGAAHRTMFELALALNEKGQVPDGKMVGVCNSHFLCAHFNAPAFKAATQSAEPGQQNIFQYTPKPYLDRAYREWAAVKNMELGRRKDPLQPAIRFSAHHEETNTVDMIFPSFEVFREFELMRYNGVFSARANQLYSVDMSAKPGQR